MMTFNKVLLAGRLTRDPEVRYTQSGTAVAELGLAVDDNYKSKTGEKVERTCFVDVKAWGRQAEICGEYLAKGRPVFVEGSLEFDQWENQSGERRSKLRVRAQRVQFLDSPRRSEYSDAPQGGAPARGAAPAPAAPAGGGGRPPVAEIEADEDDLPF
jgi:single-strand DNA-binding protein